MGISLGQGAVTQERERGQALSGRELADLNNYYRIVLDSAENPGTFIDALNGLDIVEIAFPVPKCYPPEDIAPETPDFTDRQGYLYEAPEGVDAPAAWEHEGGRGATVKIIDIEGGWMEIDTPQDLEQAKRLFGP